jgi:hypothetical protein
MMIYKNFAKTTT